MPNPLNIVYFSHGKESGPWGSKVKRLAHVAQVMGFHCHSVDYTHTFDPDERVQILLDQRPTAIDKLVLVGSSMGSYVSTVASETLHPQGLFLLAPAFFLPDYNNQDPTPHADLTAVVHGWHDSIIPVESAIRFARQHQVPLHLLNDDHRLINVLPTVERLFRLFLEEVLAGK